MDPVGWRCRPPRGGPMLINKVCVWCAWHRWGGAQWRDTCCGGVGTAAALYLPAVAHLPKVLTLIAASSFIAFRTVIWKSARRVWVSSGSAVFRRGSVYLSEHWPESPPRLRFCSLSLCPGLRQGSSDPPSPRRCHRGGTGSHLGFQSAAREGEMVTLCLQKWAFNLEMDGGGSSSQSRYEAHQSVILDVQSFL